MKKFLLLALSCLGTLSMQAQETTSPWAGNEVKEGTFYLYNVETGMWLQHNRRVQDLWTTHMQIDKHGFDVVITALADGAYQLNPRFGHNQSINGKAEEDYGYMDTGRGVTPWYLTPIKYYDVPNTYEIANDPDGSGFYNNYMNVTEEDPHVIDNLGMWGVWQLVTKEERLADLEKATKASPKDATWLINGWDFANQDERNGSWQNELTGSGSGVAFNQQWPGNRAAECWSKGNGEYYQVITGLPNGTYGLTVQGYYRDGSTSGVLAKHEDGSEVIRAWYFANDSQQPFMSICDNGVTEEIPDVFLATSGFFGPGDGGSALPHASNAFYLGYYKNPELKVVVSDGTLRIGVRKESDVADDWLVFDNFELTYYGSEIDLDEVLANLQAVIDEVNAYTETSLPALTEALAAAEAAKTSSDAKAIAQAATTLQAAFVATKAMNAALASAEEIAGEWTPNFFTSSYEAAKAAKDTTDPAELQAAATALAAAVGDAQGAQDAFDFFKRTAPFAEKEGVASDFIAEKKAIVEASESLEAMNEALDALRMERRMVNADTHEDVFAGNAPADGDYYIYNVGLKRFLCGGGDWGAHAYVGFPGVEVTLIADRVQPEEGEGYDGFQIDTHLNNGGESEFLNYGGYMDTPSRDLWAFLPVEGKEGVYNIARANGEANAEGQRMLLGYRPNTYGNIDTDMYGESNPDNQWKLVTKAERDALLAEATTEAPQDASYKIACPNFNQREDDSSWVRESGSIYGRGGNNPDFAFECWNATTLDLSQVVYDLEPGWYRLTAQGYYRDGNHENQILEFAEGNPALREAKLFAEYEETQMMNILDEIDKAPGMGDRGSARRDYGEDLPVEERYGEWQYVGEFPKWIYQACNWFQMGLYKNSLLVEVDESGTLQIGVLKDREFPEDWVVVDNFRLTYYGTEKPDADAIEAVTDDTAKAHGDGYIYNIAGQRVSKATRGLYVKNGRKIIVK